MPVSNISNSSQTALTDAPAGTNPKGILGKDDFLKLLLVELQYQDPTEPMDSEKILSQTSQLATLESASNTNEALENLSIALGNNLQFSTINSIGKIADTQIDSIPFDENDPKTPFELYFDDAVQSGQITISDTSGNVIKRIELTQQEQGVYSFEFDGITDTNTLASSGNYKIEATYQTPDGQSKQTRLGRYPIESVRFDEGQTLVKLGTNYIPFERIKEVF